MVGQLNWFAFWISISWQHTNTYKYIAGQSHTPLLLWLWYFCWSCWLWCWWWWCRYCFWCPHLPLPREASVARLAETAFPSWVEYDCVFSFFIHLMQRGCWSLWKYHMRHNWLLHCHKAPLLSFSSLEDATLPFSNVGSYFIAATHSWLVRP